MHNIYEQDQEQNELFFTNLFRNSMLNPVYFDEYHAIQLWKNKIKIVVLQKYMYLI